MSAWAGVERAARSLAAVGLLLAEEGNRPTPAGAAVSWCYGLFWLPTLAVLALFSSTLCRWGGAAGSAHPTPVRLGAVLSWLLLFRKWPFLVSFPSSLRWCKAACLALVSAVASSSFGGLFVSAAEAGMRQKRYEAERWPQETIRDGNFRNPALFLKVAHDPSPG